MYIDDRVLFFSAVFIIVFVKLKRKTSFKNLIPSQRLPWGEVTVDEAESQIRYHLEKSRLNSLIVLENFLQIIIFNYFSV